MHNFSFQINKMEFLLSILVVNFTIHMEKSREVDFTK